MPPPDGGLSSAFLTDAAGSYLLPRCRVLQQTKAQPGPLDDDGVRIENTWQAMSLRATMSNDVVLDQVFFPDERAAVFTRPAPGKTWVGAAPAALQAAGLAAGRLVTGPIMLGSPKRLWIVQSSSPRDEI